MRRLKAQLMGMFSGKSDLPPDSSYLSDSATYLRRLVWVTGICVLRETICKGRPRPSPRAFLYLAIHLASEQPRNPYDDRL